MNEIQFWGSYLNEILEKYFLEYHWILAFGTDSGKVRQHTTLIHHSIQGWQNTSTVRHIL